MERHNPPEPIEEPTCRYGRPLSQPCSQCEADYKRACAGRDSFLKAGGTCMLIRQNPHEVYPYGRESVELRESPGGIFHRLHIPSGERSPGKFREDSDYVKKLCLINRWNQMHSGVWQYWI